MTTKNVLFITITIALLALGVSVYYVSVQEEDIEDQTKFNLQEKQSEKHPLEIVDTGTAKEEETKTRLYVAQDSEKYKNGIQDLLNKQCQALSNNNLGLLISTMDQSSINVFQEYKQSVEILLSMTGSVLKCQYTIQDIRFKEDVEGIMAETAEKGDLQIRLIDGSTKIIEDPNILSTGKYIKIEEDWKQVID